MDLGNEAFALRDGEIIQAFDDYQPDAAMCIAVMARTVEMPDGPKQTTRTKDGAPIEKAAILAAIKGNVSGAWQWLHIAPETKEAIGDYLFDEVKARRDRWYYLTVFRSSPAMTDDELRQEIGNLLDHWEGVANDLKNRETLGNLPLVVERIRKMVEDSNEK